MGELNVQENFTATNGTASNNGKLPASWHRFPCHFNRDDKCSCGDKTCESPAKHPLPIDGFKAATNDSQQLEKWWRVNPQANVGVATGEINQLVVIDIDADHGGFETLLEIEEKYGRFPETVEARTGSGGLHLYFRYFAFGGGATKLPSVVAVKVPRWWRQDIAAIGFHVDALHPAVFTADPFPLRIAEI